MISTDDYSLLASNGEILITSNGDAKNSLVSRLRCDTGTGQCRNLIVDNPLLENHPFRLDIGSKVYAGTPFIRHQGTEYFTSIWHNNAGNIFIVIAKMHSGNIQILYTSAPINIQWPVQQVQWLNQKHPDSIKIEDAIIPTSMIKKNANDEIQIIFRSTRGENYMIKIRGIYRFVKHALGSLVE
jgi:hypothetical protein